MRNREHLVLFLIGKYPFLEEIYSLVKIFGRAGFPASLQENLHKLVEAELIKADRYFSNKTPASYVITEKGRRYLSDNVSIENLLAYVKTLDEPEQLLKLIGN